MSRPLAPVKSPEIVIDSPDEMRTVWETVSSSGAQVNLTR